VPYGGIDREEDWPRDQAAKEADADEHLEVAHKQVSVDGLVIQNVSILGGPEVLDPAEEARALRRRLALVANAVNVGTRRIHPAELPTEDEEQGDEHDGEQEGRYEGRDERGERVGLGLVPVGTSLRVGLQ